jgi:hypothetical protein
VYHLTGRGPPTVSLRLSVTQDADLARVRDRVETALTRLAVTSGVQPSVREVLVSVADRGPGRVS